MSSNNFTLNPELIRNALESDSDLTPSHLSISNISSEKDFEQKIQSVEEQIEKEDTNDLVVTITAGSEPDVAENKICPESLNVVIEYSKENGEICPEIDKSVLCNLDKLFPEDDSYKALNFLRQPIQALVNLENNTTDQACLRGQAPSIDFISKSIELDLPAQTRCIATNLSRLYIGTDSGEILTGQLDFTQNSGNFNNKLYTPSPPSASITCICISRDSKWLLVGTKNGTLQLLQFGTPSGSDTGVMHGLNFLRNITDSQPKKQGGEFLSLVTTLSCPKMPIFLECLSKNSWESFLSICKGFSNNEFSISVFMITATVLSYKLTMVDSLPFENLSLAYQPEMVSIEIDLEFYTTLDSATAEDKDKRVKDVFNFTIFQPGLVYFMNYTKNKSISITAKVPLPQCKGSDKRETRGVWVRSASTFQSILFVSDSRKIYLLGSDGEILSYTSSTEFDIPYDIISLKRISLSIVFAIDLDGGFHLFQVLGNNESLVLSRFVYSSTLLGQLSGLQVWCGVSEQSVEAKGCKKFVATVNSIINSSSTNRRSVLIDTFLCKFGYVCIFNSNKLHVLTLESWYDALCKFAFNKKFLKSLRLLSGIYQSSLPRLLEFQSNKYKVDVQKLLVYTLHQSCAHVVKMKKELGNVLIPIYDVRLDTLNNLSYALIDSCLGAEMYEDLIGLLFRSFNGISLTNLFVSHFLTVVIRRYSNRKAKGFSSFPLGVSLSEVIANLFRDALNEIGAQSIERGFFFLKKEDIFPIDKTPTDASLRYHLIVKLLHHLSNFAIPSLSYPILLDSGPLESLASEFELWDLLVKLKIHSLTSESLVYFFDTFALQLARLRESIFENCYYTAYEKLKKLSLPLIPPPALYRNTRLAIAFSTLIGVLDYNSPGGLSYGYFNNPEYPSYTSIYSDALRIILEMSFGKENVGDAIVYTKTLLHPVLTESLLLSPQQWYKHAVKNPLYHPVLKSHYKSYDILNETDDFNSVSLFTTKYVVDSFKLYALSFMVYHAIGSHAFSEWDELVEIYESLLLVSNLAVEDSSEVSEVFRIAKSDFFGNCPTHSSICLDSDFDIMRSCFCYQGYLLSLLGVLVKRLMPLQAMPKQLSKVASLDLDFSVEDRVTILEALLRYDDILELGDETLANFLSRHFRFVQIDRMSGEIIIDQNAPKDRPHHLLTWSILNNINIIKRLDYDLVRRVLFYSLSKESLNSLCSAGLLKSVSDIATKLLDALFDSPELQADVYILLVKTSKGKFGQFDRFDNLLERLCQLKSNKAIMLLKKESQLDIKKCLEVATYKYPYPEARSYLLERAGNVQAALDNLFEGSDPIDFEGLVAITLRSLGKISDRALLEKWIEFLENPPLNIGKDCLIKEVTSSLITFSKHGLDLGEYPDLLSRYLASLDLNGENSNEVVGFLRQILRLMEMKRSIIIEASQIAKQILDASVENKIKSLSRGVLIGAYDHPLDVCGSCKRSIYPNDTVRVFYCGHAFHSECKPQIACPLH